MDAGWLGGGGKELGVRGTSNPHGRNSQKSQGLPQDEDEVLLSIPLKS